MARTTDRTGTWWKVLLASGSLVLAISATIWAFARDWGGQTTEVAHLKEACVGLKDTDKQHGVRIDQVEGRVGVLEVGLATNNANQIMILKRQDEMIAAIKELNGSNQLILQELRHRP